MNARKALRSWDLDGDWAEARAHGFTPVGADSRFGRVYSHPKFEYVVKLYKDDPCYTRFVAMAMAMPNPHFPRFRGKLMKITNGVYVIRMERLTPLPMIALNGKFEYTDVVRYIEIIISGKNKYHDITEETEKKIEAQYPQLNTACVAIRNNIKNIQCNIDINGLNVMLRGNIPVIIDPIADHSPS